MILIEISPGLNHIRLRRFAPCGKSDFIHWRGNPRPPSPAKVAVVGTNPSTGLEAGPLLKDASCASLAAATAMKSTTVPRTVVPLQAGEVLRGRRRAVDERPCGGEPRTAESRPYGRACCLLPVALERRIRLPRPLVTGDWSLVTRPGGEPRTAESRPYGRGRYHDGTMPSPYQDRTCSAWRRMTWTSSSP